MRKPVAVLTGDVHYNLQTLALADAAMSQAIVKAQALDVPLIVAGDLHDTKALMRGECVNALIKTFSDAQRMGVQVVVLIGNHDLINEKGKEHSLGFLAPYATIIDRPMQYLGFHFIPYQATAEAFLEALADVSPGATLIMHQGVSGSAAGEYAYDHSAITKAVLADFRTISSHYHRAQDIKCGRPQKGAVGLMSYVGNPYSLTFAEHADGPKGFQVLYDDGLMEQVPTNLRKHVVAERTLEDLAAPITSYLPGDLLWLKVTGPSLELEKFTRAKVAKALGISESFKFDKIPTDSPQLEAVEQEKKTDAEIMDALVDASPESAESKGLLKALWRRVMS